LNPSDFKTQSDIFIANTSVDDRLAVFSPHNNQIAYIGLSTGNEEIWLTDKQGKQLTKLTQFNDSRHIVDLLWSAGGDYLLGLALNQIYLIDSKTGDSEVLKTPQVEIRGVSWKSEQIIAYSTKSKNAWRVNYYDLETHQTRWAWQNFTNGQYDLMLKETLNQPAKEVIKTGSYHFDLSSQAVFFKACFTTLQIV
jgi:Tol biopolymer transport system component|tara:strand:- start:390 stop:974 length:585 start_codon:yes stop_codon:yes gene_type:complete